MQSLAHHLDDRNNNFNLIRMLAALAVIFSHSFILAQGPDNGADAFAKIFGMPLSSFAVETFFIISGLLVTKSLIDRNSLRIFFLARFFRIFPGLIVAVLFSACIVGLAVTELPIFEYLNHPDTKSFIIRNIWLFDNIIQYSLPGVFTELPYKYAVNGSLWTLPWEVFMYSSIFILFLVNKSKINMTLGISCVVVYLVFIVQKFNLYEVQFISPTGLKLIVMFYTGVLFYLARNYIKLNLGMLAVICGVYYFVKDSTAAKIMYPMVVSYALLSFAYLVKGRILAYNKIGDFSYGTYIYAFPIQQMIVFYIAPGAWELIIYSTILTVIIAAISWHLIESPSMKIRHKLIDLKWLNNFKFSLAEKFGK